MSGYPHGQWPGNHSDGRYSKIETDPLMTSMAESAPVSRMMPGGGETLKRLAPSSGEDFTGVPIAKRSRSERGGLPVRGQGQEADWRHDTIDEADMPRTLFVFNLMPNTTASDLFQYFIKFGDLMKFDIISNDEGKSTGTGIIQFVNEEAAHAAFAAQPHFIHKKQLLVSHDRRDDPKTNPLVRKTLETHKLYVANIPPDVSEEDLCKYFSQWGNISYCNLAEDARRTRMAKFVFVSYTNFEDAVHCLNTTHSCGHTVINVHVAEKCKALRDVVKEVRNDGDDGTKEVNKLYVSNIPPDITAAELREHFSMWGKLYFAKIIGNVKRNNKYGFVSFHEREDALTALIMPHTLRNQRIFTRVANRKGGPLLEASKDQMKISAIEQKIRGCFLYVPNLNTAIDIDDLHKHFKMYGGLASFMVKPSGNRLFAFMAYVREVDAARCYHDTHFLNNEKLTVCWSNLTKWAVRELKGPDLQKSDAQASEPANPARPANPLVHASPANLPKGASAPRQGEPARNVGLASSTYPIADPPSRKLSISGLAEDTRAYKLKCYFSKWGKVEDFEVVKDARSRPTGCAFVIFENRGDAEKAVSDKPHVIDDKEVEVTFDKPHKVPPTKKLSVSGLAVHTRDYKLLWYFSRWGPVEDVDLVTDVRLRPTGRAFVIFENQCDAEKAVSCKSHIIDEEKVEVTFTKPPVNLPSETVPSRREQKPRGTVQLRRLLERIKSLDQGYPPEAREPRKLLENAQPQRLRENAQPQRLHEDAQPQRLREDAQPQRLHEDAKPRKLLEEAQLQRLPKVYQLGRKSTPKPLTPGLTQRDIVPDTPLVTEYECNVSGCSFKGESGQFERHWTKIHEAKVLYLICSFCTMGCVDPYDLREHLDFFHGIEDTRELSSLLLGARQQERDNIHFIMPGSVTRETCMKAVTKESDMKVMTKESGMKVAETSQKKDVQDVHSCTECTFMGTVDDFVDHWVKIHSLGNVRCPKCPKKLAKKRALLLHLKNMHPNTKMRTEEQPDNVKENCEESQNFGSSHAYHELPRSKTEISDIDSKSPGNRSVPTIARPSLSAALQSDQSLTRPQLPISPYQKATSPIPPVLASQVPTQQAVSLHGQVTPFYPSAASDPKPVQRLLTPPPLPPSVIRPAPQASVGSQSYPSAYPQLPVHGTSNTSTRHPVVASRPALSAQSYIAPDSQVAFQPQVSAQLQQACIVASPHTQVVASVAPSVVAPTFPETSAPFEPPLTGQVMTQSASAQPPAFVMEQPSVASVVPSVVPPTSFQAGAPLQFPLTGQVIGQSATAQPPEFVMEQPPDASQPGEVAKVKSPSSIPELDAHDFDMGNIKTQDKEKSPESGMVTKKTANDALKRSVQPGSVLALRPEWMKTFKTAHPLKPSLDKNTSEKNSRFTTETKFIPKFDTTHSESVQKFLLWSHIMMERLEEANIKIRRRLKADEEDNVAEGDDDEMFELSSDEESGDGKSTAVKGTLSQAREDMKARAQTVAEKVVADYRRTNTYSKATAVSVASNKGQPGKGVGKQRMPDRKVLGQLFHKSAGMIRYQCKRANVDADLVRQGISWVKQDIRRMLEQNKMMKCEAVGESSKANFSAKSDDHSRSFQQRRDKGERPNKGWRDYSDRSRKERQQRTGNRVSKSEDLQQRTDNGGRSRKERQQRTDNSELSRDRHQHRTENRGRTRAEFPDRRDQHVENKEPVEVYMDEYANEDEEFAHSFVDEDGVYVMDDGTVMDEGGHVERQAMMDEDSEEEYLEYRDNAGPSFSKTRNSSVEMRRNEHMSQSFENQMPRESMTVEDNEYFDERNECFVEEENDRLIHSERVVEVVNYDEDNGELDTAWSESADQDGRMESRQERSFGRVCRRLDRDRGFSDQRDRFKRDNSVTRRSQERGSRAHSKSSSSDKSVRPQGERSRGREIRKQAEHFRKDNSVTRNRKDFVDDGTTKPQKLHSKQIDERDYQRNSRNRSQGDKVSSSRTESQYLKKEGVDTKSGDQMSSGNKSERTGGDSTEGDVFEWEQDDLSEGALSGDGSLCDFDMDDIDMGDMDDIDMDDFVVMDEV